MVTVIDGAEASVAELFRRVEVASGLDELAVREDGNAEVEASVFDIRFRGGIIR